MATDLDIANRALSRLGAARIDSLTSDTKNARAANSALNAVRDEVLADHPWNCSTKRATLYTVSRAITGVTFASSRYRVAIVGHPYKLNDPVDITLVVGPTGANVKSLAGNVLADSFDLVDPATGQFRDSTGQAAYVSGGNAVLTGLWQHRYQYYLPSDCLRLFEVEGQRESDWLVESGKLLTDLHNGPATSPAPTPPLIGHVNVRYAWRNAQTSTYPPLMASAFQSRLQAELALEVVDSPAKAQLARDAYNAILFRAKKSDGQEQTPSVIEEGRWVTARLSGGTTFGGKGRF